MFSGHCAFPNDYANAQRSLPQIHRYYTCNLVYRALCFVYLEIKKQNKYNLSSVQKSLNRNWQLLAWRDFPEFLKMETEFIKSILLIRFKFRSWAKQNLLNHNWQNLERCNFPDFLKPGNGNNNKECFAYMWTSGHCDWLWFLMKIRKTRKSAHPFPVLIGGETLPDCCWVQA